MPRDSTATKARILEAAFREFAAYGLAGARIDRIAHDAQANKRAIYDYFGGKQQLFDITLVEVLTQGTQQIPRLWDDLPEMAGRIYDFWTADPDRMRLHVWRQLERPQALDGEIEILRKSVEEMTAAQPKGSRWNLVELYALIWALNFTWSLAPTALPPVQDGPMTAETVNRARRAAIVQAVRQLITE